MKPKSVTQVVGVVLALAAVAVGVRQISNQPNSGQAGVSARITPSPISGTTFSQPFAPTPGPFGPPILPPASNPAPASINQFTVRWSEVDPILDLQHANESAAP